MIAVTSRTICRRARYMPTTTRSSVTSAVPATNKTRTSLWQLYCRQLEQNPWRTKVTLAGLIFAGSDLATQRYSRRSDDAKFDYSRACASAGFGVIATSFMHVWWGVLEKVVNRQIQHRLGNTLTKVALDQSIGAPTYLYMYYTITNFCQEVQKQDFIASYKSATQKASDLLMPTLTKHWRVWPAVHSVNFYFVPLQHRILVQNTVLVGWSGYLSYLNHEQEPLVVESKEVVIARQNTIAAAANTSH